MRPFGESQVLSAAIRNADKTCTGRLDRLRSRRQWSRPCAVAVGGVFGAGLISLFFFEATPLWQRPTAAISTKGQCTYSPTSFKPKPLNWPLNCVSLENTTVAFADAHTLPYKERGTQQFPFTSAKSCDHINIWLMSVSLFFSPGVMDAAALLPSRPEYMVIDNSKEHGSMVHVACRLQELVTAGAIDPLVTQVHMVSQGLSRSFDGVARRHFNNFWLFPQQLTNLQEILRAERPIEAARLLCLGGFPRPHKLHFLAELDTAGALQDAGMIWSAGSPATQKWGNYEDALSRLHYSDAEVQRTTKFLTRLPHIIDIDVALTKAQANDFDLSLYHKGRIHIVLETDFVTVAPKARRGSRTTSLVLMRTAKAALSGRLSRRTLTTSSRTSSIGCDMRVRYTEKTLKAILSASPFLLYAAPGTLAILRGEGFKTFAPYINETYDRLPSHGARVGALIDEARRILLMSPNDFEQLMADIEPIASFNLKWLLSDIFMQRVSQQALYAFGLSSASAFPTWDGDNSPTSGLMDDLLTSLKPECS